MRMREREVLMFRRVMAAAAVTAAAVLALGAGGSAASAQKVTLTLWHNYGTESNAVATVNLVKAYEKLHPDVTIKVVSQPADNYFALLQAASISKTGPDLVVMWTGLFDLKYAKFLLNLQPYFSAAETSKINGLEWMAPDFDLAKGFYVMPLENQFYIGFYNKALFKQAGISAPPQTWSQLYAACAKLKAAGITPMLYGADTQNLGAEFYPFYDFSYLMAATYSPAQWRGLYTGQIQWTSATVTSQMNKWVSLRKKGCTNSDVLTKVNLLGAFIKGEGAMIVDGNWDMATLQQGLGGKLAPFVPPYSDKPMRGVIEYPGDGFSITSYSKHQKEAVDFLKFMMTAQAAKIVVGAGLIPDIKGFSTDNAVSNAMLAFHHKKGYTAYPMLDNVIQPEVVDTASKQLVAAFGGSLSVQGALKSLLSTLNQVPPDRKGKVYH